MDPHGPTAQRFPLVARHRPACLPLPERINVLIELADAAVGKNDQGLASAVYNQAALVASDIGVPRLARTMCRQHAAAFLHACPLRGMTAIRALEPVVNLARLRIRAGCGDDGRNRLLALFDAVDTSTPAQFDGVTVPANLTTTDEDRQAVRAWLWRVLLADGTRTLTTAGRWPEALAHVEKHHGVGNRMLDGRQVAVLTALTSGDPTEAETLLTDTVSGDPWEQNVTACLATLCRRALGKPVDAQLADLVDAFVHQPAEHGMTVFTTRLGLTVLDAINTHTPAARRIVDNLHDRTNAATDGYAARECLTHHLFAALSTNDQTRDCRKIINACAFEAGALPEDLNAPLTKALRASDCVIRDSVTNRSQTVNGVGAVDT